MEKQTATHREYGTPHKRRESRMSRGFEGERNARRWALPVLLPAATAFYVLLAAPSALAAPPAIEQTAATEVGFESATLRTVIDPGERATSYFFEYGTAPCSASACTKTPPKEIDKGPDPVAREEPIEGLTPGTAYFYRVVAKNADALAGVKGPDKALLTLFSLPPFPACPGNDPLRKGPTGEGPSLRLPDCRAYERASPKDKNGVSLIGELAPLRASVAGDAVNFETSSGIPGAEGAQNFPYYLATRGAFDWATQGLLPHGSAGDEAKVTGWTRDFSWSYSSALKTTEKEQAYLARSSAGALPKEREVVKYTDLGQVDPQTPGAFFFAGAATDGSIAYFEATGPSQGALSPKAAANRNNLYAWERDTEELHLAGVLPGGLTPKGGSLAGPYDWARGTSKETLATGGAIRRYYTQDGHAVSGDGSRAFFTAGDTGQLYLRENAAEPSASTQHVSGSQREDPDPLGARPAAFMAATPDGSHAFFTSPEKLTDDATTGPEAKATPAVARAKTTEPASDIDIDCLPAAADWVDVDGKFAYWTDTEAGTIGRAELGCDEASQNSIEPNFIVLPPIEIEKEPVKEPGVLTPSAPNPKDLAVNATDIYWTNATDGKKGNGTIGRAGIEGEEVNQEWVTGASNPIGIDVNETHVYWANQNQIEANDGTIGCVEIANLGSADQECILMGINEVPKGLALGTTQVYLTTNVGANASLMRMNLNGSGRESFFISVSDARGLALDATHAYWAAMRPRAKSWSTWSAAAPLPTGPK
jgi:hypothetical protein